MSAIFVVWDMETFHQVGAYASEAEAEAVLHDVLRVNGPSVAREMAVLLYPAPGAEPVTALEGAAFVARVLGTGADSEAQASPSTARGGADEPASAGAHGAASARAYLGGKRAAG